MFTTLQNLSKYLRLWAYILNGWIQTGNQHVKDFLNQKLNKIIPNDKFFVSCFKEVINP